MNVGNQNYAAVVLAAGQSRRFNGIKQLSMIGEQTLLNTALSHIPMQPQNIYVVLGAEFEMIKKTLNKEYNIVKNESWYLGLSSSIVKAIGSIKDQYSHVLVTLADQVALNTYSYNRLLDLSRSHEEKIIAAQYQNRCAVPAVFPKKYYEELLTLTGDTGAKELLSKERDNVLPVSLPEALKDIDTYDQWVDWVRITNLLTNHTVSKK